MKTKHPHTIKAFLFMLTGIMAYQLGSLLAVIVMTKVPLLSAIYLKSIGAFLLCSVAICFVRHDIKSLWQAGQKKPLLLLLLFSVIDSTGWMGSIYFNGLTGSTILAKLIPIILILYGVIFLKEKLTPIQIFAGFLMILASASFSLHAIQADLTIGLFFHALLVFGYCGFAIMMKNMSDHHNPYLVMWSRAGIIALVIIPLTPWVIHELENLTMYHFWVVFGLAASFGFLNGFFKHAMTMSAYRLAPLSWLTFISEISAPLSFMIGFFVFQEDMSSYKWIATAAAFTAMLCLLAEQVKNQRST